MHAIKDSVHDHISLDPVASALLDTPAMQRLRHIKQLSTVRLVYPSASHSRFEHSLGVYHLADRTLSHLGVEGAAAAHARAAALIHDAGHGPYGHQTEDLIMRHTGRDHDELSGVLASTSLGDVLGDHDLDPDRVASLVRGEGDLGQLISGELDVDRMDYLVRDAHHTGVPYGTVDHERLVRELRFEEGELVLAEGNVQTAESLLLARALMNATVYRHHVSRIAGAMLERACERLLETTDLDIEAFSRMADHDLLAALSRDVPDLARRLEHRDLFKRACWVGIDQVPAELLELDHDDVRAAEEDIADRAGVAPETVVVDVPDRPSIRESTARVVVGGEVRSLADASELVGALRSAQRAQWRLGVYTPPDQSALVGRAARAVLGVDCDFA